MNKINFKNYPDTSTPISAENLNQMQTNIDNSKVEKVEGKGLSTNDFTTVLKEKLDGISSGANKTTIVNNLTSTSTTSALSSAQGKVLNDKIPIKITTGSETATNEYIDGKQIYVKRVNLGALPNAGSIEYTTGLSNVTVIRYSGVAYDSKKNAFILPFIYSTTAECIALLYLNETGKIRVVTGTDRSVLIAYVNIYYTKN